MLWNGVNAENALTHKILAAVAFARREKSLQFIFLTCCGCDVGGMQPIGCCVIEGAWDTCVLHSTQQRHVPKCLFCCSTADVRFVVCAGLFAPAAGAMEGKELKDRRQRFIAAKGGCSALHLAG
ncbi:hypothetical protein BCY84_17841 [Trypanosoma cruzi cruzi]|nr:hypothetical protein BCY84_17841 [Trypanosoma cruzi cruzi]